MEMVNIKINGRPYEVPAGTSILKAAQAAQVNIPTLCHHPDLTPWASCGLCIVKMEGSPKMFRSCATAVESNRNYITHDSEIVKVRKTTLELILSRHPNDCLKCGRNQNCELQRLSAEFGIREVPFVERLRDLPKDDTNGSIVFDYEKCIMCGRCAEVCQDMQNVWALEFLGRGFETRIAAAAGVNMGDSPCIKCGQCSAHCPVGAIYELDETKKVWDVLTGESGEKDMFPIVQIAPAVRVAIGESFGYEPGEITTGKLYAALRRLGFKAIFDTNFSADLTILEEGTEFVKRFTKTPEQLPLITSCCPAWIDYLEKYDHEMINFFSTAKSPQQMLGAMAKTYYAQEAKIDPAKIFSVSIMPCTAKKFETDRNKDMFSSGFQDVDIALTTRELARMIKQAGIDFRNLPEEKADSILGEYTGAGTIFGATGGVMEAALRSAYYLITKENLKDVNLLPVRGLDGVKEATIDIKGTKVNVAVAHGLVNVQYVLDKISAAKAKGEKLPYDFIEVMSCRGGCVGGGGQPYGATDEVRAKRAAGIYTDDEKCVKRLSHENQEVMDTYKKFLGEPGSEKAHKLLHTHYTPKKLYNK